MFQSENLKPPREENQPFRSFLDFGIVCFQQAAEILENGQDVASNRACTGVCRLQQHQLLPPFREDDCLGPLSGLLFIEGRPSEDAFHRLSLHPVSKPHADHIVLFVASSADDPQYPATTDAAARG